jgi:hypothetical protein
VTEDREANGHPEPSEGPPPAAPGPPLPALPYRSADEGPRSERPNDHRYEPLTTSEYRARRVLRGVPTALLAVAAIVLVNGWLLGATIAWGIGTLIVMRLHARSLNARLKALAGALARNGDPFVAMRALEAIVADSRPYPGFHSIALLFLGITRARSGDADGALALLHTVERARWLSHRDVWKAWLLPWLASLHAARGDLEEAELWLAEARAALPLERHDVLVAPEALVSLRRGRDDEAIERVDAYVTRMAASEPIVEHFALLRAFASHRAGKPVSDEEVRKLVAARIAAPGRAMPLERWWPEFAEFLNKHGQA